LGIGQQGHLCVPQVAGRHVPVEPASGVGTPPSVEDSPEDAAEASESSIDVEPLEGAPDPLAPPAAEAVDESPDSAPDELRLEPSPEALPPTEDDALHAATHVAPATRPQRVAMCRLESLAKPGVISRRDARIHARIP
jgi:hypothetical protein